MKKVFCYQQLSILVFLFLPLWSFCQTPKDMIRAIQQLMTEHYIFLDKAEAINAHLDQLMEKNHFDQFESDQALATAITTEMRKINDDKHLSVYAPREAIKVTDPLASFEQSLSRYRNPMVKSVQLLDNNVGYVDLRFFGGGEAAWNKIDVFMAQLEPADALIVDLRNNGGGSISTVQYFSSYFFEEGLLLNSIYARVNHQLNINEHTREIRAVKVKGRKRPDLPVFVLTSSRTFSGAEDFSYTLQSFKKAQVIGEVSRGGAHPIDFFPLANGFRIKIPFAMSIHPVTKSNWEGVGIIPDLKVPKEDALDKALILAAEAAQAYKASYLQPLESLLKALGDNVVTAEKQEQLRSIITSAVEAQLLNERDINRLGYGYLSAEAPFIALALFQANAQLFSSSANAHDSYAEALAKVGENDLALENYQKAVSLAVEQEHYDLPGFRRNLKAFQAANK